MYLLAINGQYSRNYEKEKKEEEGKKSIKFHEKNMGDAGLGVSNPVLLLRRS